MGKTNFADSIVQKRAVIPTQTDAFNPLHNASEDESKTPSKSGYRLHHQQKGKELSLILEMANGDMLAPEYTYLVRKELLKSKGIIMLYFTDCTIELKGRNLKEIFLQLCRHSVASITEIPLKEDDFGKEEAVIHEITAE